MKPYNILFQLLNALDNLIAHTHWFFSDERQNPYRCPLCGGTDIHIRAWLEVNRGNRYVGDCEDTDKNWCESCQKMIHTRTTDWFVLEVNEWWSQVDFPTMERVTRYCQDDFGLEDGCQDFVDACNEWWHKQPIEETIKIHNDNQ